jgi:alkanesulfonate monooxygenase SsuD/methylene tetrahydromethanopterin reductase-like flavin-dependent oxidoreductase (luciferase family)
LDDAAAASVADRIATRFVGDAGTVADQLETLRRATGADELLVTTITHDHDARVRSYELLAAEWARRADAGAPDRSRSASASASATESVPAGAVR